VFRGNSDEEIDTWLHRIDQDMDNIKTPEYMRVKAIYNHVENQAFYVWRDLVELLQSDIQRGVRSKAPTSLKQAMQHASVLDLANTYYGSTEKRCYKCNIFGHFSQECTQSERKQDRKDSSESRGMNSNEFSAWKKPRSYGNNVARVFSTVKAEDQKTKVQVNVMRPKESKGKVRLETSTDYEIGNNEISHVDKRKDHMSSENDWFTKKHKTRYKSHTPHGIWPVLPKKSINIEPQQMTEDDEQYLDEELDEQGEPYMLIERMIRYNKWLISKGRLAPSPPSSSSSSSESEEECDVYEIYRQRHSLSKQFNATDKSQADGDNCVVDASDDLVRKERDEKSEKMEALKLRMALAVKIRIKCSTIIFLLSCSFNIDIYENVFLAFRRPKKIFFHYFLFKL
jgi:hypothetical protein